MHNSKSIHLMVRCILISLLFQLSGCFSTRNQYKEIRVPIWRFSVKPSQAPDLYLVIDTSALYVNVKVNGMDSLEIVPGQYIKYTEKQNSIKFYANGRIAGFQNVDFKSAGTLNPANAKMGMYGTWKKRDGLYAEDVSHSAQAGVFLIRDKITVNGDTLYRDNGEFNYMYIKKKIPAHLLIYKPDW